MAQEQTVHPTYEDGCMAFGSECVHFEDFPPLDAVEVDDLCERINADAVAINKPIQG